MQFDPIEITHCRPQREFLDTKLKQLIEYNFLVQLNHLDQ